ncbi:MAG TPA: O-antigen ligase family protein, partial [Thermoleophilaceae bacterium]|nr:O-antigen ligase family protein [Thermoleophilaceae bacterium]
AFQSGAYDVTVRNQFAIAALWAVAVAVGALVWPLERQPRAALVAGGALAALLAWTAVAIAWSDSAERAVTEVNRIAFYLALFAIVVAASRRGSGARWADGLALGIAATALLGLVSRLFPDLIGDRGVSSFFPGGTRYLGYPLDYWNGLGIFVGLGFPLLLRAALDARSLVARSLAVGFAPALFATLYLTSSRGGMGTAALGTLVFVALYGERLRALVALAVVAAGAAGVVAVMSTRTELADGNLQAEGVASQGGSAALWIAGICAVSGLLYTLATRVRISTPTLRVPRPALAAAALVLVAAALVAADPAARFESFKQPPSNPFARADASATPDGVADTPRLAPTSRHLLSSTGNGRWQFWGAAVDEFETRPLTGRGPGSYEAWWAQHGSVSYFTRHAHSLYLETLGELGAVGLLLLLVFLGAGLGAAARRLRRVDATARGVIAALAGVVVAFCFAAGIDWIWQLTVVPVVAIIALAVLAGPPTAPDAPTRPPRPRAVRLAARLAVVVAALALIAAQVVPFLAQDDIRRSQHRFAAGDLEAARAAAVSARRLQPWAASPYLQLALVEERRGELDAARSAISQAIERDRLDWRLWLTAARMDSASGLERSARAKLDRAIKLNPRSPVLAPLRKSASS